MFLQINCPVQIYNTYANITVDRVPCDLEECFGVSQIPGGFASWISILIVFIVKIETIIPFLVFGELPILHRKVAVDH